MRIIGGQFKGRRFQPPKSWKGRPTTDFARESLFNILNNEVEWEEAKVLDLFSGTGAIALEAVSRGAADVYAIEMDGRAASSIERVAEDLDVENLAVYNMDVFDFLDFVKEKFDLIVADPPFYKELGQKVYDKVVEQELLTEDGLLIIEHDDRTDMSTLTGFVKMKRYGNVRFSFFRF